mmetsp:Transcript_5641/g.15874  ORF Transcript_5641/g.15874 Transcript_5641/m.15874 type:complete len:489 (-) Transcript_5641:114-1580(-)
MSASPSPNRADAAKQLLPPAPPKGALQPTAASVIAAPGDGARQPAIAVDDPDNARKYVRNVRICMWVGLFTTLTMQAATGAFLDIYMFKISGSNALVGGVESVRGIAQLIAAPFLGMLTDRVNRYRLAKLQAITRIVPISLLAYAVATDTRILLYIAMPIFAISSHLGDAVRQALLADNIPDGPDRTRVMSRIFSLRYVGTAASPLLQIIALFAVGGLGVGEKEGWQLSELRLTLIVGCCIYLVAEPAQLFLRPVPPVPSLPAASPAAAGDAREVLAEDCEVDWREDKVMTCWRGGVKKMWAVPILIELIFLLMIFGGGMSVKYFPLYFTSRFGLSPLALCILNFAEPVGVALLCQANHCVTRRLGRALYASILMFLCPCMIFGVAYLPTVLAVAPFFVLRTATGRAYIPLFQSIVATCVPFEHRGKFAALQAFRMSFFSASAFVGSYLADKYGSYQPAFLVTAAVQLCGTLLFVPVVVWMPKGPRDA